MFKGRIYLLVLLALLLWGCGKTKPRDDTEKQAFRFCILAPGSFGDASSNQRCYEAMQDISSRWKLNVQYFDNVKPNAVEACLLSNSKQSYDFVIALGEQLLTPLVRIASSHPQLKIAIIGQYRGNFNNLGALSYQPSHHYLAGVVAALKSKNAKIAALTSNNLPQTKDEVEAFFNGARKVNPNILTYSVAIGNAEDKRMAVRYVEGMKKNNVDVIFVDCGSSGAEIHLWAARNKIMTVGSIDDQYSKAPRWVIASVVTDYNKMLSYAIGLMLKGQWQGIQYRFGMAEKITDIAPLRGTLKTWQEDKFYNIYRDIAEQKGEIEDDI